MNWWSTHKVIQEALDPEFAMESNRAASYDSFLEDGAPGGIRTRNPYQEPAPKAGAVTSFATGAQSTNGVGDGYRLDRSRPRSDQRRRESVRLCSIHCV